MNIAVILAGGIGERFNAGRPKQFTEILNRPMISYCLDIYEKSNIIDAIEIVCLEEYIEFVWELVKSENYNKVQWICAGGSSCQETTKNGIFNLKDKVNYDDMLTFNMSSSLFVSEEILQDSLLVANKFGNAFACMPCVYNNAETENGIFSEKINRKEFNRTLNMPWTSSFGKLYELYKKAYDNNIETGESAYMPTLFLAFGEKLYFSLDDGLNKIHIQRPADKIIAEAIIEYQKRKGIQ